MSSLKRVMGRGDREDCVLICKQHFESEGLPFIFITSWTWMKDMLGSRRSRALETQKGSHLRVLGTPRDLPEEDLQKGDSSHLTPKYSCA